MAHSIDSELHTYIDKLNLVQKKSLLSVIKSFLKTDKHISIEEYNNEIDAAMARMDSGGFISQEDLENEAMQW